jgi:hypothetical protein
MVAMGEHHAPVTEWDEEEQREELSNRSYPEYLKHWVLTLWPLWALMILMAVVTIWYYRHS